MPNTDQSLLRDLEIIQRIPIVPTILEVICQTTGMGFAAVARVTDSRWLACSVRDEINFGLKPGGELPLDTTLCNEVKDKGAEIVIDNVSEDETYAAHHTPKLYGLQSYIAYPITLKNGKFFGTLCAIDPRPANLKEAKIAKMFSLFADLLSFHIQSLDLMEKSQQDLENASRDLTYAREENLQYQHISAHTLREPLRKILIYGDMLVNAIPADVPASYNEVVLKIRRFARDLDRKVNAVADIARLRGAAEDSATVDLNIVARAAADEIKNKFSQHFNINIETLPVIQGYPGLLGVLFYHLFHNAVQFAKPGTEASVTVAAQSIGDDVSITVIDQGVGIEEYRLKSIFNFFEHSGGSDRYASLGTGLSSARRIVHLHKGQISASCSAGVGTVFTILLPVKSSGFSSISDTWPKKAS
jgi:signal transduction histidine kinase